MNHQADLSLCSLDLSACPSAVHLRPDGSSNLMNDKHCRSDFARHSRAIGFSGQELKHKTCAARRVIGSRQAASMRFDNRAADAKAACRCRELLVVKKALKISSAWCRGNLTLVSLTDSSSSLFRAGCELTGQLTRPIHVVHGVDAIHDEVHQHLLQLHAISYDIGRSPASSVRIDMECRDASSPGGRSSLEQLRLRQPTPVAEFTFLEEQADRLMISEARFASLTILHAASRASFRSGSSRVIHRTQVLASVTIAAIGCFARRRGSELSHGGQPAGVREIRLRLTQRFFGTFAFGYVPRQFRCPNHAAQGIFHRGNRQRNVDQAAILAHTHRLEVVDPLAARELLNNRSFFVTTLRRNNQCDVLANRFFRSVAEQPFCPLFQLVMTPPFRLLLTIASCDDSTIAASKRVGLLLPACAR